MRMVKGMTMRLERDQVMITTTMTRLMTTMVMAITITIRLLFQRA
jgi:hypothetical protein